MTLFFSQESGLTLADPSHASAPCKQKQPVCSPHPVFGRPQEARQALEESGDTRESNLPKALDPSLSGITEAEVTECKTNSALAPPGRL